MNVSDTKYVLAFLRGESTDHRNRTYANMLALDDVKMEMCHDQVQWLFPLHEISKHAHTYPVLTKEIVEEAKKDKVILANLRKALDRFERFLAIGKYDDVDKQRRWCQDRNHNLLRITRVIRCLRLFGLVDESTSFYCTVAKVADRFGLSNTTLDYWDDAWHNDVWASLQK